MNNLLHRTRDKIRDWVVVRAQKKYAEWWLAGVTFAEASFFPIPPEAFLIPILISKKEKRWVFYGLLVSGASLLGGLLGYAIGYFFFDFFGNQLISFYGYQEEFLRVQELFSENAFWAIFSAAFTPIPYKIFTIAAGLFNINLATFFIASLLGRSIRFFGVSFLVSRFGEVISGTMYKYFNLLSILVAVLLVFLFYSFF